MDNFALIGEAVKAVKTYGFKQAAGYLADELDRQGMGPEAKALRNIGKEPEAPTRSAADYVGDFIDDPVGTMENLKDAVSRQPESIKGEAAIALLDKILERVSTVEIVVFDDEETEE